MGKLVPTLIPLAVTVLIAISSVAQGFIGSHPMVFTVVSSAYAVLTHWLPSPAAPAK